MKCHDNSRLTPTRRQFLYGAGATALGLAAGCSRSPGQKLTNFVYSGLDTIFQEHFVEPFEASTGAKVVLDAGGGGMPSANSRTRQKDNRLTISS